MYSNVLILSALPEQPNFKVIGSAFDNDSGIAVILLDTSLVQEDYSYRVLVDGENTPIKSFPYVYTAHLALGVEHTITVVVRDRCNQVNEAEKSFTIPGKLIHNVCCV